MNNVSAEELRQLKEDPDHKGTVSDKFFDAQYKHYKFVIKGRNTNVQGEDRFNFNAFRVGEYSVKEENKELLKRLAIYKTMPDLDRVFD